MKEKRVWIGLAVLFAVIGVPQLFWKPSRFGGIFLLALAIGCMGEWLMLCGREKHKACRILSRVGRVLFALFVLSFAAVQVFVIGIAFDEDDPSAAPQAACTGKMIIICNYGNRCALGQQLFCVGDILDGRARLVL